MDEYWVDCGGTNISFTDSGTSGAIATSAADASRDWLLGGGLLLPDALRRRLDAVGSLECLDLLGQFGDAWPWFAAWLRPRARQAGLELVTQGGQFGQVGVVREGLAHSGLIVAELRLRDAEVSLDAIAFGAVATHQAFQSVQDGTRPLVLSIAV